MFKYLVTVFLFVLLPIQTLYAGQWSGIQKVELLYVFSNSFIVKLTNHPATSCADNSVLSLEPNGNPMYKEMYSMLLSAKVSNQDVDVNISGCGTEHPTHPRIIYVRMGDRSKFP